MFVIWGGKSVGMLIKDFEMRKIHWIIRVSPKCHHICPHERQQQVYTDTRMGTHGSDSHMKMEAEVSAMQSRKPEAIKS